MAGEKTQYFGTNKKNWSIVVQSSLHRRSNELTDRQNFGHNNCYSLHIICKKNETSISLNRLFLFFIEFFSDSRLTIMFSRIFFHFTLTTLFVKNTKPTINFSWGSYSIQKTFVQEWCWNNSESKHSLAIRNLWKWKLSLCTMSR